MTEAELAFIREIAAARKEIEPRLIYADWLEEQGDFRSEYLRLQCELALEKKDDARRLLQQRGQELQKTHEQACMAALGEGILWHSFYRGLVDEIIVDPRHLLDNGGLVLKRAPITGLRILLRPGQMREFAQLPELGQVRRLWLSGSKIGNVGIERLLESPHVPQLTELSLVDCGIESADIARLVQSETVRGLRRLNLAHNRLTQSAIEAMAASPHLRELRFLNVDDNEIERLALRSLIASPNLPNLEIA